MTSAVDGAKHCSRCQQTKPVAEFARNRRSRDGLQWWCSNCRAEHRAALPTDVRQERMRRDVEARRQRVASDPALRARMRDRTRLRQTGIATEARRFIFEYQRGCCAICGSADGPLHLDHDHACCPGKQMCPRCVRGMLCSRCNMALGLLGDDPSRITAAARYLEARGVEGSHQL